MDCANDLFMSVFYKHLCFYPLFSFCPQSHYDTNVAFFSNSPRYLLALCCERVLRGPCEGHATVCGGRRSLREARPFRNSGWIAASFSEHVGQCLKHVYSQSTTGNASTRAFLLILAILKGPQLLRLRAAPQLISISFTLSLNSF